MHVQSGWPIDRYDLDYCFDRVTGAGERATTPLRANWFVGSPCHDCALPVLPGVLAVADLNCVGSASIPVSI
jgi:hypothetical protein